MIPAAPPSMPLFAPTPPALVAPADPAPAPVPLGLSDAMGLPFGGTGFALRDYQREDVAETFRAWADGRRGVVMKEATGLGKSVLVAELARRLTTLGRVLIVVDVGILAEDLAATVQRHTGQNVGVLTGKLKENWRRSKALICTVQTLYAGGEGREWFRELDPADFAAVLVDECETSIAERYSGVVRYFLDGNPSLVIAGLSATPRRGDGRGMGELYDHASQEPGPLNRSIVWGRDNGWLVHVRQAFVRVSIDFSTLKLRKDEDGVKDYAEADLLRLFESEQALRELAEGIHQTANEQPAIVICPNSVEFAKALAHHLEAVRRGSAHAVYGQQGQRCDDLLAAFKRGDYPYVVSVNKLYKGFDADRVKYVCMCRKTKSARLYEQAMGRGTRPLVGIRSALDAEPTPEGRRAIVAASGKPWMVMADLVGVDRSAKDMGVVDILAGTSDEAVRERAKRKMIDGDGEQESEAAAREAEKELAEEARQREAAERKRRSLVQVKAHVDVEYSDDLGASGGAMRNGKQADGRLRDDVPTSQILIMRKGKVPDADIRKFTPEQCKTLSREIVRRWKLHLCSYKQAKLLRGRGYTAEQVKNMRADEARTIIDGIAAAEGWGNKGGSAA